MRREALLRFRGRAARALRRWADTLRASASRGWEREEKDTERVAAASRLLQVSEFEFFRIAHFSWYGREMSEEAAEQPFSGYLLRQEIPFWVRHLARRVRELHSRSALDPGEFGVDRPPPLSENRSIKVMYGVLLGAVYSFFFLLLAGYLSP